MSIFGRKKKKPAKDPDSTIAEQDAAQGDVMENSAGESAGKGPRTAERKEGDADAAKAADGSHDSAEDASDGDGVEYAGPYDVDDENIPDRKYFDLGAIKIPGRVGIQLRLTANGDKTQVTNLTVTYGQSSLQLTALAAPRALGLWDSVREGLLDGNPEAQEADGDFGKEVLLKIPIPGGRVVPTRIVGVDGPRWMLRGIFTGPASRVGEQKRVLDEFFASVVVDRGSEPLAPREPLILLFPQQLLPENQRPADGEGADSRSLPGRPQGPTVKTEDVRAETSVQNVLERGPMFSEVR
ncbi:MAG: DUF3710 domain-containing protein [Aeriscardovia sp.]|nr:DUF3710 domain-containing protein [Aeriscardovia sp.]